jgi:hypothetical protein
MKTLHVIDANKPYMDELVDEISNRDPLSVTVVFTGGMSDEAIAFLNRSLHVHGENFHITRYVSTANMLVNDARRSRFPSHLFIGQVVTYEPTASVFSMGGLTIPVVFEQELQAALSSASTVTICVRSPE